ncbi:MAG: T9SS type A sorting domain-containing protein, partial [Flavobacteriales bacterium]|nr:T9SS type A sorting domain-containing protein [Flavobacteriales bacterium]
HEDGSPSNNSRNFTLLGDPAITLAYPKEKIATTSIKVTGNTTISDTIRALNEVEITGEIRNQNGVKLTNFQGILYPTIFDKVQTLNTLGNDNNGENTISFQVQKNAIFKGKASVTNGNFSFKFVVPKDIGYQYGEGRISYYAENGNIDASGIKTDFIVGGTDTTAVLNEEGPEIELFLNDDKFVNGGTTNENPNIYAKVYDENGINTVGIGIGHDITAVIDGDDVNPIVLNEFYESDIDSYKSGVIKYPLSDLSQGPHTITLKVWDVQNNSSERTKEFVVKNSKKMELSHVLNYPNPFTLNTSFYFEHNQPNSDLDISIQIFTLAGNLIKTINQKLTTSGFRSDAIPWDGRSDYGEKLGRGTYLYRITVQSADGFSSNKYERLVIL